MIVVLIAAALAAPPAARGEVALLDNGRVVAGEVERVDGQYRVRRGGDESRLPLGRVLFVGPDLASVYDHLRGQLRPDDARARVRLARWCLTQGLKREALAEATAATALAPKDASAKLLKEAVERLLAAAETVTAVSAAAVTPVAAEEPPAAEYNSASYPLFATKVHSVLVNRCASCHAAARPGGLVLSRGGDARSVRWNLAAALARVDRADPSRSALLVKGATVHGDAARPPLDGRETAFGHLERWAYAATAPEGTPPESVVAVRRPEPAAWPEPAALAVAEESAVPLKGSPAGGGFAAGRAAVPATMPVAAKAEPAPTPAAPADPFDPAVFNKQTGATPPAEGK